MPPDGPSQPDVSVVIVNYNTRDMLRDCLDSVFKETRQAKIEVIVVDNNSSDDSCAMLQERFPQVILIPNPINRGFAAANNQALRQAAGRYCLLLNPDTIILDGAIDKCLAFTDANPRVGAVGPRVFWPDGRHQSSVFRFPRLLDLMLNTTGLPRMTKLPTLEPARYATWDWNKTRDVDVIAGCFLLPVR